MDDKNVEILDFDDAVKSENVPSQPVDNVILDNSTIKPAVFDNLSVNNVNNGINALSETENLLNESIKNNFGTNEQLQSFNDITTSLKEDKKQLDSGVAETEKWFRESQEKKQSEPTFNAAIDPTLNNLSSTISFDRQAISQMQQEQQPVEEVYEDNKKSKKGIAFIVILFILLFAFVFALPYLSTLFK